MKNFLLVICTLFLTTATFAQNSRLIKGVIQTENGNPIKGAVIKSGYDNIRTTSIEDGSFEIRISPYATHLGIAKEGYIAKKVEIESSNLVICLIVDKSYKDPKKKAEEQAQLKAKKIAEEQAQLEAKRKAEELARLAAKKMAEEQAQLEIKKLAEEAERKRIVKENKEKLKAEFSKQRKGYGGMIDISYINSSKTLGISYIAGYRFNNQIFLGAGTGVSFNFKGGGPSYRHINSTNEETLLPSLISIPLFAYFKANFINSRTSPYFAIAAGGSFSTPQALCLDLYEVKYSNNSILVNPQLGMNIRTTTETSLNFGVGLKCYTVPVCKEFTGYNATISSAFVYGLDFHLGFTF